MDRVYITVRRTEDKSLQYSSRVAGQEFLHYDGPGLLHSIAVQLVTDYRQSRVIFRNRIPEDDSRLKATLSTLVHWHNLALELSQGQIPGERAARRLLEK